MLSDYFDDNNEPKPNGEILLRMLDISTDTNNSHIVCTYIWEAFNLGRAYEKLEKEKK
jgi:hypothetical protein